VKSNSDWLHESTNSCSKSSELSGLSEYGVCASRGLRSARAGRFDAQHWALAQTLVVARSGRRLRRISSWTRTGAPGATLLERVHDSRRSCATCARSCHAGSK